MVEPGDAPGDGSLGSAALDATVLGVVEEPDGVDGLTEGAADPAPVLGELGEE